MKISIISIFSIYYIFPSAAVDQESCDLYIAPSVIPGSGRGIFAGKLFSNSSTIDIGPVLTLPKESARKWPLFDYVYSADDGNHSVVAFGVSSIFNHFRSKNVERWWYTYAAEIRSQNSEAHATYTDFLHEAIRDILPGEEILTSYGDDSWFEQRGIKLDNSLPDILSCPVEHISSNSFCLSDIAMNTSTIPLAGRGMIARKHFQKGDIVSISPIVLQPKHEVIALRDDSIMLNFCITSPESDVSILPLGMAAMINHGGIHSNLDLSWHIWPGEKDMFDTVMNIDPKYLVIREWMKENNTNHSNSTYTQLYLAYTANRDISSGEEVLINYGIDWELKWSRHLRLLNDWMLESEERGESVKPLFRHSIEAPPGLFPDHWKIDCVGSTCGEDYLLELQNRRENTTMLTLRLGRAFDYARENFVISPA